MANLPEGYTLVSLERIMIKASTAIYIDYLYQQLKTDPTKESKPKEIKQTDLIDVLSSGAVMVIVQYGGAIVSMGTVSKFPRLGEKTCVIEDVVTSKEHRRQGLARAVMMALIKVAKGQFHAERINLNTRLGNFEANALYKSLGFKVRDKTNPLRLLL